MTAGQRHALDTHWPDMGLNLEDGPVELNRVFGRQATTVLEIGFGMGDSLVEMAQQRPDTNYLGVEVHGPGIGRLLMRCAASGIGNIRIFQADAVEVLARCIPDESLAGVQLYFPDPWPKKKHHKRRLVQTNFIELIAQKLQPGGYLHMATDWQDYAEHMMGVMNAQTVLFNRAGFGALSPRPQWRPLTKFERRGENLGHGVWDLLFEKPDLLATKA